MLLKAALLLANEVQSIYEEMIDNAEALAVLSSFLLNDRGYPFREAIKQSRRAIQVAYNRLTYRHAWVVCGQASDAMETLLKRWDEKPNE